MTTTGLHPYYDVEAPLMLTSHAGDTASGARSGSMTAYRRAHALGFRAFQVDVVAVAGDQLLSMHAVFGRKLGLERVTLAEARRRAGDDIPTLDELIEEFPGVRWNIELKSVRCERALVDVIERHPRRDLLCVSAPFHTRALRRLRRRFPDLATNASLLEGALVGIDLLPWRASTPCGVQLFAPVATSTIVAHNLRRGRVVHAWTVDDERTARRLYERGVRGLVVDDYDSVAPVLDDLA